MLKIIKLFTSFLILFTMAAHAQDTLGERHSDGKRNLMVGINFSPDYCYRTIDYTGSVYNMSIAAIIDEQEIFKIGYTGGVDFCYNLSGSFGIESGVQYSNKGYAITSMGLTFGDMLDPRYGFVVASASLVLPTDVNYNYNFEYLDIPLRTIFSFGKGKFLMLGSIGINFNFLLRSTQTMFVKYNDGSRSRSTSVLPYDFNNLNISPSLSVGVGYRFHNKFQLRAEPTIRYGLIKIINAARTAYLWNAGLNVSCYYTFN